jgi:hypothetical protein
MMGGGALDLSSDGELAAARAMAPEENVVDVVRHSARHRGFGRPVAVLLCIFFVSASLLFSRAAPVLAAASITLDPVSGSPGTAIIVTGSGFPASTYGYVYFDANGNGLRDSGEPYQFPSTTSAGDLPAGVTLTVPAVAPGDYDVIANIPTASPLVDASATFAVTGSAVSLSLTPISGTVGTAVTVSGNGFAPSSAGFVWFDVNDDGVRGADEPQAPVTSNAAGEIPSGITLTAPSLAPGTCAIRADIPTGGSVEASATFTIVGGPASLSLNPSTGTLGTTMTIIGSGFAPNAIGQVWFDTNGNGITDGTEPQIPVTVTAAGVIPAGVTLTVSEVAPNSTYWVHADIPSAGSGVEASASFKSTNVTLWLTVTKYDAHKNILDSKTVTYQWMESNLPVQGDTSTHRYHQGPTFDDTDFASLWDPGEMVNIDSRDYGRAQGTDVKDLANLVGGAAPGDTIKIRASDNFSKWFDYEDVYAPEPEQGKLVVAWYNADFGGYVPAYDTGMRLIFFADNSTNPWGWHVFGDWDMHETLPPSRWHFYFDGELWPSSSGLSVQNVYDIEIYQPNLVSCDASGNPKDSFAPGETVYVKGLGLSANTSYKVWLQPEPVLEEPLDSLDRPEGTFVLNTGNDPSGSQETVTTDGSGDFSPVAVWAIGSLAAPAEYDIVADNQASGAIGTYDSADAIDNPGWKGFAVNDQPSPVGGIAGLPASAEHDESRIGGGAAQETERSTQGEAESSGFSLTPWLPAFLAGAIVVLAAISIPLIVRKRR